MELKIMTETVKFKDIKDRLHAKILKSLAKLSELTDESEITIKKFSPSDTKFEEGERAAISYITTIDVDRDDEVVLPNGIDFSHYNQHRVVLLAHDRRGETTCGVGLGKNQWIKSDAKGLIAKTIYANTPVAETVWQYRKDGFPMGESIGFIPTEIITSNNEKWKEAHENWKTMFKAAYGKSPKASPDKIISKAILLEYSDVLVPANQAALQLAVSKGLGDYICNDVKDRIELEIDSSGELGPEEKAHKVEVTEEDLTDYNLAKDIDFEQSEIKKISSKITPELVVNKLTEYALSGDTDAIKAINAIMDEDNLKEETEIHLKPEGGGWDETDTSCRYRVRDPDDFQEGSLKTKTIKSDKPMVKAVIGKLPGADTTKIQSIIFPKSEGWTMEKARKWLGAHPNLKKGILDEFIIGENDGKLDALLVEDAIKELKESLAELKGPQRVFTKAESQKIRNTISMMEDSIGLLSALVDNDPIEEEIKIEPETQKIELTVEGLEKSMRAIGIEIERGLDKALNEFRDKRKLDLEDAVSEFKMALGKAP